MKKYFQKVVWWQEELEQEEPEEQVDNFEVVGVAVVVGSLEE